MHLASLGADFNNDIRMGRTTKNVMCCPIYNHKSEPIAILEVVNVPVGDGDGGERALRKSRAMNSEKMATNGYIHN
tara:strand:- start:81 stop:308 length:228 start_codon:yes stop_codon:yes gene_type:complete